MPKASPIKTSFTGGEFSPLLRGRVDVAQYANACKRMRNALPRTYGPAINRPGSVYVNETKDSSKVSRLLRFAFNRSDAYAIEMGEEYFRFFTKDGRVVGDATPPGMDSHTKFLAHFNGSDGATTYTPEIGSPLTFVADAQLDTAQKKFGTASLLLDGTGDYVTIHDTNLLNFSTDDFTIDFYFRAVGGATAETFLGSSTSGLIIRKNNATTIEVYADWSTVASFTVSSISNATWYHLAIVRKSGELYVFLDGVLQDTKKAFAYNITAGGTPQIGTYAGNSLFNGHIDELCIRKDTAVWTAGFTPQAFEYGSAAAWVTATEYDIGDYVLEDEVIYVCLVDHTSGTFADDLADEYWSATEIYEVDHTYQEADLPEIHCAQNKDVINLVHEDYVPKKLTRVSATSWKFEDMEFKGGPFLADNITSITITPSATTKDTVVTLTASSPIFQAEHIGSYWKIGATVGDPAVQGYVKIKTYTSALVVTALVMETLSGTSAFTSWAEGAWSSVRGYPSRVVYHQGRLCFARTTHEPQKFWASKPFLYNDFTTGSDDGDALNIGLETNESNDIRWIESSKVPLLGTFGGDFVITPGNTSEPLTPDNATASNQTNWASESIQPERIGTRFYYVQVPGRKVREMYYLWDEDTYKAVDVTIFSEHLTESGIKEIAFQQNPDSVLWCVLNNGKMATMVRELDQQVMGWSLHETDGLYESVCCIPDADEDYDEVWVIVNRTIDGSTKRYVEYFENPEIPENQLNCFFVDCGLKYNAFDLTEDAAVTLALDVLTGAITFTASGDYFADGDVGKRIRAIDTTTGEVLGEATITAVNSATEAEGTSRTDFSTDSYAAGAWGLSITSVSGLDHIEGEEVSIFADGGVIFFDDKKEVASGAISLENPYFVVAVGLPYESIVETMSIEAGSATGTAQGKMKRVYQVGLKLYRTLGIEMGGDDASIKKIQYRNPQTLMGIAEALFTGEIAPVPFNSNAVTDATIVIQQRRPLPMCILAVMPLMETNDK